jgi:hypothetical protein
MRRTEPRTARTLPARLLLAVLAVQAVTPDANDLASTALPRCFARAAAPACRPETAWHTDHREATPDELALPGATREGREAAHAREGVHHAVLPGWYEALRGGPGRAPGARLPSGSAGAGAGRSMVVPCRLIC